MTLLKNDNNILPLPKDKNVLVTGIAANSLNYLNGAWSRTWDGQDTTFNDTEKKTILEAVNDKIGKDHVIYVEGTSYDEDINTSAAVDRAEDVDFIIACLGEQPATEKPSDIDDLNMPYAQLELVKALSKTGKPIILVLLEARPRIISEIEPLVPGILMAYLPANEGGRAIAEVLFGDFNPCGKLPFTYPRYSGSIWTYDHPKSDERDKGFGFDGFNPQYEFGTGLSYTNYRYENLVVSKDTFSRDEPIEISVDLTNVGNRKGKEVVQLYSTDLVACISPAVKQLRRFRKVELAPNETEKIKFQITKKDLAFVDSNNQWITEEGDFEIRVDTLVAKFYLQN